LITLWILLGTSNTKLYPVVVILGATFYLPFLFGLDQIEAMGLIQKGFGKLVLNTSVSL